MTLFSILTPMADLIAPFAVYQLLAYISDPEGAVLNPLLWLVILFIGPMSRTVCFQQYIFTSTRLIVRIKSGMTQELYHRAMSSMELEGDVLNDDKGKAATAKKTTHAGQLQNLMSGDVDAIYSARDIILKGVGGPVGALVAFAGLYRILGWPALLGGIILVASIPIPVYIGKLMGKSQRQAKATQDARISLISEYLSSVVCLFLLLLSLTRYITDCISAHVSQILSVRMKNMTHIVNHVLTSVPSNTLRGRMQCAQSSTMREMRSRKCFGEFPSCGSPCPRQSI